MKTGANLKNRQRGAVAVMVGVSMVLFIGLLAMVIDLGHLYVAKTGLQNAADAAALAGVKELDGTSDGVTSARNKAIAAARLNTFFANSGQEPVVLSSPDIQFGVSQNGPWDDGSNPAGTFRLYRIYCLIRSGWNHYTVDIKRRKLANTGACYKGKIISGNRVSGGMVF